MSSRPSAGIVGPVVENPRRARALMVDPLEIKPARQLAGGAARVVERDPDDLIEANDVGCRRGYPTTLRDFFAAPPLERGVETSGTRSASLPTSSFSETSTACFSTTQALSP